MNRGEKTASAMECQLTSLEKKIDDLLASMDTKGAIELTNGELHTGSKSHPSAAKYGMD